MSDCRWCKYWKSTLFGRMWPAVTCIGLGAALNLWPRGGRIVLVHAGCHDRRRYREEDCAEAKRPDQPCRGERVAAREEGRKKERKKLRKNVLLGSRWWELSGGSNNSAYCSLYYIVRAVQRWEFAGVEPSISECKCTSNLLKYLHSSVYRVYIHSPVKEEARKRILRNHPQLSCNLMKMLLANK